MTERTRALSILFAVLAVAFFLSMALASWADVVAIILVAIIGVTTTAFVLLYALTRPWWEYLIGRAMLASSAGVALLADISLLYAWLGDDYALRDAVRLTVYFVVAMGGCYKLSALLLEMWHDRNN